MKAPALKDFGGTQAVNSFAGKIQAINEQKSEMIKKTFSLSKSDYDYIQQLAILMAQEAGQAVSASKALRSIIEAHQKQSS